MTAVRMSKRGVQRNCQKYVQKKNAENMTVGNMGRGGLLRVCSRQYVREKIAESLMVGTMCKNFKYELQ